MSNKVIIQPQKGPQEKFLSTSADICIYGGAAGGGKTYGLLLEPLRYVNNKDYNAIIFRRNYIQLTSPGGLWESSRKIYSFLHGTFPLKSPKLHWNFKSGATVNFAHLGSDEDCNNWQGSQIAMIGFDELTHFTKYQFFYMLSRNRTTCGIRPYIRATCNPDADSWVADFIRWWIDADTGYPITERNGKIRYMVRINGTIFWGDTKQELVQQGVEESDIKSVTFIASTLQDNRILMEKDPSYLANLKALPEVEMERLLKGNWKIKACAGKFFQKIQIPIEGMLLTMPTDIIFYCRAWDFAATDEDENGDADYTSGVLMGKRKNGKLVILDVINQRIKAGAVEHLLYITSIADKARYGYNYRVRIPQDPGAAGKIVAQQYIKLLAGFDVVAKSVSGSKQVRATPFAAQWQNGMIEILIAEWNEEYFNQLESFPESKHDDMVDASSDAFNECVEADFGIDNLL